MLLNWGKGSLVEKGSADISLALDNPKGYSVYQLDTSGDRIRKLKSKILGNQLQFTVCTEDAYGMGCIYYEVVKK